MHLRTIWFTMCVCVCCVGVLKLRSFVESWWTIWAWQIHVTYCYMQTSMISVKGRCMKPRSRSIHLKQKQGRSTCRAQTRFLLCLQQDFVLEVWLSWHTSTFVFHEFMCVLRDIQEHRFDWCARCLWKWDAIVVPVFSSSIGVHRYHFFSNIQCHWDSSRRNTSIYKPQKLQPGNLKADHSTAISNRNLLFKGVHVPFWLEVKQVASYSSSSSSSVRQDGGLTGWLDCLHK